MRNIVAGTFIVVGCGILYLAVKNNLTTASDPAHQQTNKSPLEITVENDLSVMEKNGEFPYAFNSIREVQQSITESQNLDSIPKIRLTLPTDPNGTYKLKYTLIPEQSDNPDSRLMVQFEIFDLASNSKVWEKIRLYDR